MRFGKTQAVDPPSTRSLQAQPVSLAKRVSHLCKVSGESSHNTHALLSYSTAATSLPTGSPSAIPP